MAETDSNFPFVDDAILRANLDLTFNLIVKLVPISVNHEVKKELPEEIVSSVRKQIIINTASIIEALILSILKKHKNPEVFDIKTEAFKIDKTIYVTEDGKKIVLGHDSEKIEKCRFDKLNLGNMIDLCHDHGILNAVLLDHIKKVKEMRNRQHLGSLKFVDGDYTHNELEFVFSVAKEVKNLAKTVSKK